MAAEIIDVWDATTFDNDLSEMLERYAELIRNYMITKNNIFLTHDIGKNRDRFSLRPTNPYASSFFDLTESVGKEMKSRTVRAWHYTRLTQAELRIIQQEGIHLSTPESLRTRLHALVANGELNVQQAEELFVQSPLQNGQRENRSNMFWMSSHPMAINDSRVLPLMSHWGGEVVSIWLRDALLLDSLANIGQPCVLEIEAPMSLTQYSYSAGETVVATFSRLLGCIPDNFGFDFCVTKPLRPNAVVRVHSIGDSTFDLLGRGYPEGYIDFEQNYWSKLTGEEN